MAKTNISPYYDDFDATKNYHQFLFRPGYAVQARELTQIQSIFRNQIEQFGNHIFKQGSIVIPGNSNAELNVPYLKIESQFSGSSINPQLWLNQVVVGGTSGVTGVVKHVEYATLSDPITFYVTYTSGGVIDDVSTNKIEFDIGEDIYLQSAPSILCKIKSDADSIGKGSIAYINKGVYYVNGTFVTVNTQQTVIDKYGVSPSCHVLLKIVEEFVTSDDDPTLLDPAQGSNNFAAPGADRLKLSLTLMSLPLESAIGDDYVEIMRYREGVLEEHARTPKYNELEKSLARRTYDESGNYVVTGLQGSVSEHFRDSTNGGISTLGSRDNYALSVSPGKSYIGGYEAEKISTTVIVKPKARTADHVKFKSVNLRPTFGRYILVTNVIGGPQISERQIVELWNDNDAVNGSATKIGEARVLSIDYHIGQIYKLWLTDVKFTSVLVSMDNVGGLRYAGGSASVVQILTSPLSVGTHSSGNIISYSNSTRVATVSFWDAPTSSLYVIKHDHAKDSPRVGDQIVNLTTSATSIVQSKNSYFSAGTNSAIVQFPVQTVKSIRNESNLYDIKTTVQRQANIVTNSSGNGSITIANGVIQTPEIGTFCAFGSSGAVSVSLFSLNVSGNTINLVGGPTSTTVKVYFTVDKEASIPRTKTLLESVDTVSLTVGSSTVNLNNSDVYNIKSIIDSTGNITENFRLNTGQTDFAYYLSSITLKQGSPRPSGNIVVTYDYFDHSTGDYFVYDSYSSNTGYEDYILSFFSSSGAEYNLKNCIDMRPSVNSSNTFGAGAVVGDMFISNELISTTLQYYVPRYDVLTMSIDGTLSVISGIPDENPTVPTIPAEALAIEHYLIPAYTESVLDIRKTRLAVDRFTMKDISELSERVDRLEEFSTLTAAESSVVNFEVVDAETGLNRFKTGYLVETFASPLTIANIYSDQFSAAFDNGSLISAVEEMDCPVTLLQNQSNGFQLTNGIITLPYTERRLITQPMSSRITNLNPFLMISWNGTLTVTPSVDSWVEVIDRPAIIINRTETTTVNRWVNFPNGPAVNNPTGTTSNTVIGRAMPIVTRPFIAPALTRNSRKIICTKLYELGLMSKLVYDADQEFGEYIAENDPTLLTGYHQWANIVVDWMSGGGVEFGLSKMKTQELAIKWAYEIATPWSEEMAYQMGATSNSNPIGRKLMSIGGFISKAVYKLNLLKRPTKFSALCMLSVFAILRLYVKFATK